MAKRLKGTQVVAVRLPPDLLAALDRYIKEEEPKMTRAEALRHAFRDWAIGMTYIRFSEDPEYAN